MAILMYYIIYDTMSEGIYQQLTTTTSSSNNTKIQVSCPQLIWGKDMDSALDKYGKQHLIIASDCTYMVASLQPMWETVDTLLDKNGMFVWVNLCASTVPFELVFETAKAHDFEWEQPSYDPKKDTVDGFITTSKEIELFNDEIYIFRRRRRRRRAWSIIGMIKEE